MLPTVAVVGGIFTSCVFEAVVVPQEPPVVVKIKVAVPVKPAGGVQVAVFGVNPPLLLNVPPEVVDQVAPMALPPNDPFNPAVVPPWQIAARTLPALAVGS